MQFTFILNASTTVFLTGHRKIHCYLRTSNLIHHTNHVYALYLCAMESELCIKTKYYVLYMFITYMV